ncbi:MAG: hypothetical protein DRP47_08380 [Candidatus Zixiibacteriota bacterium]|nr:MAG: hypothetical protein DRP47_08380 [candidate division Zixibacteria bacterium]
MTTAIKLNNISKSFGATKALDALSLTVEKGAIFGLLGPNGAGKTTTMRICSTLLTPDGGTVSLLGGKDGRAARREIALMPQGKALDAMLNVRDNLRYYCKLVRVPSKEVKASIEKLANTFGITDFIKKNPFAISGGQFRRAQLARTFLGKPRYILLDEPTLGIDIQGKLIIWRSIRDYAKTTGCTILLASNDMTEIEKTCDKVGFINHGRLLYTGTTNNLSADNVIHLDCKLAGHFDTSSYSCPEGVSVVTKGKDEIALTFSEYNSSIFSFLDNISNKPGVVSLKEHRISLTDLFDKYGGEVS